MDLNSNDVKIDSSFASNINDSQLYQSDPQNKINSAGIICLPNLSDANSGKK